MLKTINKENNLVTWCINNDRQDIIDEWDNEKNDISINDVTYGSGKTVYWKCTKGHSYPQPICKKTINNHGCSICSNSYRMSFPEKVVAFYILKHFPDAIQNFKCDDLDKKEIDIFIPSLKIGIEYDGSRWHKNTKKDIQKNQICKKNNITLIRIREPKCPPLNDCVIYKLPNLKESTLENTIKDILFCFNIFYCDVNISRDRSKIQNTIIKNKVKNSFYSWCIKNDHPEYLDQWDYDKNGQITPFDISYGTDKKYWFICKNGHSYPQAILNKTLDNTDCPYCKNRKVLIGFNDLETWCINNNRQDIIDEWDTQKNNISINNITPRSHKEVYWKCKNGHSYPQKIFKKTERNDGCPYCSNQKVLTGYNDLETWCKQNNRIDILNEWDYENNNINPNEIYYHSTKKINWICSNNHSYPQRIREKTQSNCKCPYCSNKKILPGYNDLETWCKKHNRQDILDAWDYKENKILPNEIAPKSNKSVHFICPNGHSYPQSIDKKTIRNDKCPICHQ